MSKGCGQLFEEFEKFGKSKMLVVLLHAYKCNRKSLIHVRDAIKEKFPDADIYTPDLNASVLSTQDPVDQVCQLLTKINLYWEINPYKKIIIVGHSLGALLGRKLYIYACGETPDAPFEKGVEKKRQPWADNVSRIILLAGMNRGWSISHHMSKRKAIAYTAGSVFGSIYSWCINLPKMKESTDPTTKAKQKSLLIFQIRRGAPFLTNLRIQWIALENAEIGKAIVVQLLGSIDDLVSPEDNIDLVSGRAFYYLDVPKTNHENIIEMTGQDSSFIKKFIELVYLNTLENNDLNDRKKRRDIFIKALTYTEPQLKKLAVLPNDAFIIKPKVKEEIKNIVFVIHGIRDPGHWTHKIARNVKKRAKRKGIIFETETSSYGYFPILSFLMPWRRRAKVEWLMDQYAEGLAQYPKASFSYVGHSNGTYLLAKTLEEYPCCKFKHVVFAGSVVKTDFPWEDYIASNRVKAVLNYVATADWVVAFIPNAMQMLNLQDLGGAGHKGFSSKQIKQIEYVKGKHDAALNEDNWDAIAKFIIYGEEIEIPPEINKKSQCCLVKFLGFIAPLLLLALAGLLIYGGKLLMPSLSEEQWFKTVGFFLYLCAISILLTKF